jgi:hypothetical protein
MRIHTATAQDYRIIKGKLYAVRKLGGLADRIASKSNVRGNAQRIAGHHVGDNHVIGQRFGRR